MAHTVNEMTSEQGALPKVNEMIERVAKAISARMLRRDNYRHDPGAGDFCPCPQCLARAAIEAMREPTEAMRAEGHKVWRSYLTHEAHGAEVYEAMIDAALADLEQGQRR